MKIESENSDAEFYLASLALGILYGMKQGVLHPNVGIWSMGRPVFSNAVAKSADLSLRLKEVIYQFDEIDFSDSEPEVQQLVLDEMIDNCLECLQDSVNPGMSFWAHLSMQPFSVDEFYAHRHTNQQIKKSHK